MRELHSYCNCPAIQYCKLYRYSNISIEHIKSVNNRYIIVDAIIGIVVICFTGKNTDNVENKSQQKHSGDISFVY